LAIVKGVDKKIYRKSDEGTTTTIVVGKDFKKIIKTLASIIPEATFNLSENGLDMKKTDPSNVMLADLHIPLSNGIFRSFQIPTDNGNGTKTKGKKPKKKDDKGEFKGIKFSVDMEKFDEILSRLSYDDITLEIADELTIREGSKVYKTALLGDLCGGIPKLPELNLTTEVELGADALSEIVRDCYMADHIEFMATNGKLSITASDESDLIEYSNSFGKVNTNGDNASASYGRDHLDVIAQAKRITSKDLVMRFAKDMPASFIWTIKSGYSEKSKEGVLEFLLAPRIEA